MRDGVCSLRRGRLQACDQVKIRAVEAELMQGSRAYASVLLKMFRMHTMLHSSGTC
jgi:hypothetical protein